MANVAVAAENAKAAADAATKAGKSTLTFCQEYVELSGDLASWAKWFVVAALLLGIAYGLVEVYKNYKTQVQVRVGGAGALKELIEALKTFIEALAKAPTWLGLFAVGLVLFYMTGNAIPETCKAEASQSYHPDVGAPAGNRSPVTAGADKAGAQVRADALKVTTPANSQTPAR